MLSLSFVRDNKEAVLQGLVKRGFKETELIDALIDMDQKRRKTQTSLATINPRPASLEPTLSGA